MRLLSIIVLCLLLAAIAFAQTETPTQHEPRYKLRGNGLTIRPGKDSLALAFTQGVTISSTGFKLTAQRVEINIKPGELLADGGIKLPKSIQPLETDVLEDPRGAAREMARELELPEPTFSASALQRVAASGGIIVEAQGTTLRTPQLVSTDGGRSWLAEGRSTLSRSENGSTYQLAAGKLLYDTERQRAVAREGVTATLRQRGEPEVTLSADRLEFSLASGELTLGGALRVAYGDFVVTSSPLSGNVKQQQLGGSGLTASGPGGMQASVGEVGVNLKTQQLKASGGVALTDSARGIEVQAASLSVNLKTSKLTASGQPTVKFGDSTFTGEQITVSQKDGKTVVEVEGQQTAKIDPGDVERLSP